ncbi:MAG: adenine deaminase C-terminal domain-containing protein [Solirubrobacteraceae bacterium]
MDPIFLRGGTSQIEPRPVVRHRRPGRPEGEAAVTRRQLIDAALGRTPSSLVIRGGQIVNVFTCEVVAGDVALLGDRIVAVGELPEGAMGPETEVLDAEGAHLVPGFIEPHFHAAEPSLSPFDLALALLERGTTTLATDLVEFYAVGGVPAAEWSLAELEAAGLRTLFLLPLHAMGMEEFGTAGHTATVEDFLRMASWPQTAGINEPPPNTVLDGDGRVLQVLGATLREPNVFEGHGPELHGPRLQAYLAAGASSDHESTCAEDALEKLRLGCRVIMRECSASRDLRALVPLLLRYPESSRFFMVCSDDMQAKELVDEGHIDHKLRVAIDAGLDSLTAIQLATINPAEYFGLAGSLGSIAPGKLADVLLIDSLTELRPHTVIAAGGIVSRHDRAAERGRLGCAPPPSLKATVDVTRGLNPADFRIPAPDGTPAAVNVRVIGIEPGTLLSRALRHRSAVIEGAVANDLDADILKVAALDRHSGSGRIGLGFVNGVGLKEGALATTFNWPHYGLLVVGASDVEMAAAVAAMQQLGGGLIAVRDGRAIATVKFEVGGIVGTLPLHEMHPQIEAFELAAATLGSRLTDHLTALAALTIPHIPRYGLSDRGLYDSEAARFVDVVVAD